MHRIGVAPLKGGSLILALSLLTLVLGFAAQVVLASQLGVGRLMDVFVVAATLPTLVATVALAVAVAFLVPLLKTRQATAPDEAPRGLIGRVVRAAALLGAATTLALVAAAPLLIRVLAPGFDAATAASAATLLRIMAAGCFFDILRTALSGVEYARERFALPQLAPSINHALLLMSALLLLPPLGLTGLALGWTAGSVAMFALLAGTLRGVPLAGRRGGGPGELGTAIRDLLAPVAVVVVVGQLVPVVDRLVASTLGPGAISALGYGSKMLEVLLRTVPMAIGMAAFPLLSESAARADRQGLADTFGSSIRWLVIAVVPVAAAVVVFRSEIVRVLFERGAFDREATRQVAATCGWYAAALVPAALLYLMHNLMLALRRGWALGAIKAGGLLATCGLDIVLARLMGIQGIAAAFLCVTVLQCVAVIVLVARRSPALLPRRLGALFLQVGAGLAGVLLVLGRTIPTGWQAGPGATLVRLAAGGTVALLAYITLLFVTGNREVGSVCRGVPRLLLGLRGKRGDRK